MDGVPTNFYYYVLYSIYNNQSDWDFEILTEIKIQCNAILVRIMHSSQKLYRTYAKKKKREISYENVPKISSFIYRYVNMRKIRLNAEVRIDQ